mmetsp:Transcript_2243/g.6668  ORF Transcript_2243/g.6668 Transcript_2243/m.6668 type:complete len:222 (-) Transcript_2243:4267-4932(-)
MAAKPWIDIAVILVERPREPLHRLHAVGGVADAHVETGRGVTIERHARTHTVVAEHAHTHATGSRHLHLKHTANICRESAVACLNVGLADVELARRQVELDEHVAQFERNHVARHSRRGLQLGRDTQAHLHVVIHRKQPARALDDRGALVLPGEDACQLVAHRFLEHVPLLLVRLREGTVEGNRKLGLHIQSHREALDLHQRLAFLVPQQSALAEMQPQML